jgi:hypothetical protein
MTWKMLYGESPRKIADRRPMVIWSAHVQAPDARWCDVLFTTRLLRRPPAPAAAVVPAITLRAG